MNTSSEHLVGLAAAGDPAALATLLEWYEPQVLQYVMRRHPMKVWKLAAPDDIVQETCYEACRMIRGFTPQGPESFLRWLITIARLRIKATITKFRSRKIADLSAETDDESGVLEALQHVANHRRSPSASAAAHEFVATVERAIERLHQEYGTVIRHRFIEGLSVEEAATRMQRNHEQIHTLSSRALKALRLQIASVSHFR